MSQPLYTHASPHLSSNGSYKLGYLSTYLTVTYITLLYTIPPESYTPVFVKARTVEDRLDRGLASRTLGGYRTILSRPWVPYLPLSVPYKIMSSRMTLCGSVTRKVLKAVSYTHLTLPTKA